MDVSSYKVATLQKILQKLFVILMNIVFFSLLTTLYCRFKSLPVKLHLKKNEAAYSAY